MHEQDPTFRRLSQAARRRRDASLASVSDAVLGQTVMVAAGLPGTYQPGIIQAVNPHRVHGLTCRVQLPGETLTVPAASLMLDSSRTSATQHVALPVAHVNAMPTHRAGTWNSWFASSTSLHGASLPARSLPVGRAVSGGQSSGFRESGSWSFLRGVLRGLVIVGLGAVLILAAPLVLILRGWQHENDDDYGGYNDEYDDEFDDENEDDYFGER